MSRTLTLADGQLAASAGTILAGSSLGVGGDRVDVVCQNTGNDPQTVVLTFRRAGGTARRLARAILSANEQLLVSGLGVQPDDTLLGVTTDGSTVDYMIFGQSERSFGIAVLDANGALRSGSAALSGNLTVTGDLTVQGGDIDAGASGTAGSLDLFPGTASKGKTSFTAADNAGNTTTGIATAAQAGARTYTIQDLGASGSFDGVVGNVSGVGAAASKHQLLVKKTGIADNTATSVITVTVPNGEHAAAIRLTLLGSLGAGTDTFESSRCALGMVVLARKTGVNVVAAAATLTLAQIATVSGGGTLTLAYGVSSVTGAAGASNTFDIQVTLVATGTITDLQCVVLAELINAEASGVTIAAAA